MHKRPFRRIYQTKGVFFFMRKRNFGFVNNNAPKANNTAELKKIEEAVQKDKIDIIGGKAILKNKNQEQIKTRLGTIIQNQRNGTHFYENLLHICKNSHQKKDLEIIKNHCIKHTDIFFKIYENTIGGKYTPKEPHIQNGFTLEQGVYLAIQEETHNVLEIISLFEESILERHISKINNIIQLKHCHINLLRNFL